MTIDSIATTLSEGQLIVRPHLFNGENYSYWKNRMELFVQDNDNHDWKIIANGLLKPTKIIDGKEVIKEEKKENFDVKKKFEDLKNEKHKVFMDSSFSRMIKCNHCTFHDHSSFACPIRKHLFYRIRQMWVPKETLCYETNFQGSKEFGI
ncbi:Uncharacterized protein TCM_002768 [Theobroma cacao]|uniref:DUF4219 domain-containing protein n=1 Tax=Theobroma cacao TaxID=3641 RepID=A0A061DLY8_THECC|nr:Uncharacterized protein TCM_002768 [Theobroma cacao]